MMVFDSSGLAVDTYDEILAEVVTSFRDAYGASVPTKLESSMGQLQRLIALRTQQYQELAQKVVHARDPRLAEGVSLDQRNAGIGVGRKGEEYATVLGTATGTPSTSIPNGTTVSVGGVEFVTANGPYTIGGGGTVAGVEVVASEAGPVDVSILGAWTLVDSVPGFDSFDDTSQPVAGRLVETDTEYRARSETERYHRPSGPLKAIEAAVSNVEGVTYVRAYHNIDTPGFDAKGVEYQHVNVVVEGGTDANVAQAIYESFGAGTPLQGGTSVTVTDGPISLSILFDRVSVVERWARIELVTSTSEELQPADLAQTVKDLVLAYTAANWIIGTDVLPHRIAGQLDGVTGVDGITVTTSSDGVGWVAGKFAITRLQRAELIDARIVVVES